MLVFLNLIMLILVTQYFGTIGAERCACRGFLMLIIDYLALRHPYHGNDIEPIKKAKEYARDILCHLSTNNMILEKQLTIKDRVN